MAIEVTPLHYVTLEFRLYDEKQEKQAMKASGQHRFLYGVESRRQQHLWHLGYCTKMSCLRWRRVWSLS
jgi:hypothetical protein